MSEDLLAETMKAAFEEMIDARDEMGGDDDDITMADHLREVLTEIEDIAAVRTFNDVGMLSGNAGLVIRTEDGAEFQLTIVQSKLPRR